MPPRRHRSTLALALAVATAAACALPPRDEALLPVEVPEAFSAAGDEAMPERWWTVFGDPELDRLMELALRGNLELEVAWQRLHEARAVAARERARLWPELDAAADGAFRRFDEEDEDSLLLGLAAFYEVDLWGRIGSAARAEDLRVRATLADYRAAALSLSAEVARAWFARIESGAQVALLEEQIRTNEQVLALIRARFATGLVRRVDLLRQEQLVEATREQLVSARARAEVLEHVLAVLVGRPPMGALEAEPSALPAPPALPATGLPAELVRRRPDLQRVHSLLRAADHDLAAAVRDRYPRLTLTGSLATSSEAMDLFDDWIGSLVASLVAPLFDGGRRAAAVERTEALVLQRLYEYAQATLAAFREVEDALVREQEHVALIASLEEQLELADAAYEQLRTEYLNGLAEYIDVLTALTEKQRLRRALLSARLLRLDFRVALYRALAGGFETPRERSRETA